MANILADLQPGDLATWATAVVALLALGAAMWAGWTSHRLLKVEQLREDRAEMRDDERRQDQERAEQANLVAWWPSLPPHALLVVRNASQLPIYDVKLSVFQEGGRPEEAFTEVIRVMPPDFETRLSYPDALYEPPDDDGLGNYEEVGIDLDALEVTLYFRDAARRTWARQTDGRLVRMDKG